jgi:hypothetical protein
MFRLITAPEQMTTRFLSPRWTDLVREVPNHVQFRSKSITRDELMHNEVMNHYKYPRRIAWLAAIHFDTLTTTRLPAIVH